MTRDTEVADREHRPARASHLAAGRYFGAIGPRLDTDVAVVSEVVHPVARALPEHEHALDYFCMVLRGRYTETIAGRTLVYAPFDAGFHPAGVPHADCVGPAGARFLCLEIRSAPLRTAGTRLRARPTLLDADAGIGLLRLWHDLGAGTLEAVVADGVAWELCAVAAAESRIGERARPRWLERCRALIQDAYDEPWTVDGAARAVGVHPVHLSREFRRRFGRTFGECLVRARLRAACARIAAERESLAQTAVSVGFSDQSRFCKVFKARIGCSPSAFAAGANRRR